MKPANLRHLLSLRIRTQMHTQEQLSSTPERQHAQALIAAVDAGGIPLHPAKVNQIARELGLPVSREEPVEATIARIRVRLKSPAP